MKDIKLYNALMRIIIVLSILSLMSGSCRKLIEVNPPITSINGENVFEDDKTAIAALTGIYTNMSQSPVNTTGGYFTDIFFKTGMTGDELILWDRNNLSLAAYADNAISPLEYSSWGNMYRVVFICNSAIEALTNSLTLTGEVKQQLLGEAYFMRAFSYFYLTNLYGDVPLALLPDYKINRELPRTDINKVYEQIVSDLLQAKEQLSDDYLSKNLLKSTAEKVRPTKWAASALLSRVYLYIGSGGDASAFAKAEMEASEVINNSGKFYLVSLDSVFLMNNNEAIWQLQPVGTPEANDGNTKEGQLLVLTTDGPNDYSNPVYLNEELSSSFEINDQRKKEWINSVIASGITYYFPYKYKIGFDNSGTMEYSTVLRLGEQYLIRAEAKIQQDKLSDGIADLNLLRLRATDFTAPISDQLAPLDLGLNRQDALDALENERKHELFTEWGHRWFDLNRWPSNLAPGDHAIRRADDILRIYKGQNWQVTDKLYPIPQGDINLNPAMFGHQNPGYE